ncbi:MAG TPA: GNAT family N-acetyltransferase [Actinomadura sp.]|nr:GNAT family N-acetyltransferase [Actinomadura sp.]
MEVSPGRSPIPIRTAVATDADSLAAVLGRAFADDPVWGWLIPDPGSRVTRMTRVFGALLRQVHLPHAATEVAGREGPVEAGALWTPPGRWRVSPAAQARQILPVLRGFGRRTPTALRALATIERQHPEEPHWYLALLGTNPPAQGNGLGAALLRSRLDRCDREGMPAYLESSKDGNVPYYERFGFRVTEELAMPGGCPPVWLMWREPPRGARP